MARNERDRLVVVTGGSAPAPPLLRPLDHRRRPAESLRPEFEDQSSIVSTYSPDVVNLEKAIGHVFQRPELLEQALTHSSRAKEAEAAAIMPPAAAPPTTSSLSSWATPSSDWSPPKSCSAAFRNSARASFQSCGRIWSARTI